MFHKIKNALCKLFCSEVNFLFFYYRLLPPWAYITAGSLVNFCVFSTDFQPPLITWHVCGVWRPERSNGSTAAIRRLWCVWPSMTVCLDSMPKKLILPGSCSYHNTQHLHLWTILMVLNGLVALMITLNGYDEEDCPNVLSLLLLIQMYGGIQILCCIYPVFVCIHKFLSINVIVTQSEYI